MGVCIKCEKLKSSKYAALEVECDSSLRTKIRIETKSVTPFSGVPHAVMAVAGLRCLHYSIYIPPFTCNVTPVM